MGTLAWSNATIVLFSQLVSVLTYLEAMAVAETQQMGTIKYS